MSSNPALRTLLAVVFPAELDTSPWRRTAHLAGEALVFTLVSAILPIALGLPEAGFVAIFLVAAPLADRFDLLLEENRHDIYVAKRGSWRSNRRTAAGFLSLFGGILLGFTAVASGMDEAGIERFFGFAIAAANVGSHDVADRDFGSIGRILGHNVAVLGSVLCLGFVYRAYGAMLALCWNACVWAFVLTVLIARGAEQSGLAAPAFVALATLALLPHLAIEALAYVLASLSAIFASKGLARYSLGEVVVRDVAKVVVQLLALALVLLGLAAVCEAGFAPLVLGGLT